MSDKTVDEMKAELEASGFLLDYGAISSELFIKTPDGLLIEYPFALEDEHIHINKAYAHLQERKELEALRKHTLLLYEAGKRVGTRTINREDEALFEALLLVNRSWAYIERYNITADESEPDE